MEFLYNLVVVVNIKFFEQMLECSEFQFDLGCFHCKIWILSFLYKLQYGLQLNHERMSLTFNVLPLINIFQDGLFHEINRFVEILAIEYILNFLLIFVAYIFFVIISVSGRIALFVRFIRSDVLV